MDARKYLKKILKNRKKYVFHVSVITQLLFLLLDYIDIDDFVNWLDEVKVEDKKYGTEVKIKKGKRTINFIVENKGDFEKRWIL